MPIVKLLSGTGILLLIFIFVGGLFHGIAIQMSPYFSFKDVAADLLGVAFGLAVFTLNEP